MDVTQNPRKYTAPVYLYRRTPVVDICSVCHDLNLKKEGQHKRTLRVDYFVLVESAELDDCIYCTLICRALEKVGAEVHDYAYSLVSIHAEESKPIFLCWDNPSGGDAKSGMRYLQIYRHGETPCCIKHLGTSSEIMPDPSDVSVIGKILNWTTTCDETHPECIPSSVSAPKRLLDIGEARDCPIHVTQGGGEKYVALSHCWGKGRRCITTKANLKDRMDCITWDQIPKTFQDAITLTRQLGIRYLWIDSLCIIQDDLHDWEEESVKMGNIYEGAYLTIAAALSADDEEGFLQPSPERALFRGEDLTFLFQGRPVQGVRIRKTHDVRHHETIEPLSSRGWTLQERLLSSRLLTFTSGVTFECARTTDCECGHSIYANPLYPSLKEQRLLDRRDFRAILTSPSIDAKAVYNYWRDFLLHHYSARRFTRESDRLPAIHSLAMTLERRLGDKYVSGLWTGAIMEGLYWFQPLRNMMKGFPDNYHNPRAPSWSWASVEGSVQFQTLKEIFCTAYHMEHPGSRYEGGFVVIRGPAIEASLKVQVPFRVESKSSLKRLDISGDIYRASPFLRFDAPIEQSWAVRKTGERYLSAQRLRSNQVSSPASTDEYIFAEVLCLCLGYNQGALILLILGGVAEPPGTFKRIGVLTIYPAAEDFKDWTAGSADVRNVTVG